MVKRYMITNTDCKQIVNNCQNIFTIYYYRNIILTQKTKEDELWKNSITSVNA